MTRHTCCVRSSLVLLSLILLGSAAAASGHRSPGQRDALRHDNGRVYRLHRARTKRSHSGLPRFWRRHKPVRRPRRSLRITATRAYSRYAHIYAQLQQRYNGERPQEEIAGMQPGLRSGRVPYWDLDPSQMGSKVKSAGKLAGGPLMTRDGKFRVRIHYLNGEDLQRMTRAFGPPTGHERAVMTDSYRTLLVDTQNGPQVLKFSARGVLTQELLEKLNKELYPRQVKTAVRASGALKGHRLYNPEPAALWVSLGDGRPDIPVLHRKVPVASRGLRRGDVVLPEHVLSDPDFARSRLGRRIFARHGSQTRWFRRELAPRVADAVWKSLAHSFYHAELHPQNLDVVVNRGGKVLDVRIKDLQDLNHDAQARAAAGKPAITAPGWELPQNIGKDGVAQYYANFLGQLGNVEMRSANRYNPFAAFVARDLTKIARKRLDLRSLEGTPEYQAVFGAGAWKDPMVCIGNLRELMIKAGPGARR